MAAFPNCGKEVIGDFIFCPYCEAPLKPICPSCNREVQSDFLMCPYCGFSLYSETPAKLVYKKAAMSNVLTLVVILSFAGAVIAILRREREYV
ncbi:MAG TPA: zinc ribbon domain-containing protein [Nitrososphaerales archaeon]|nr:zinc ribbon domain-containing protein [Nitrososphaerales archaeon]